MRVLWLFSIFFLTLVPSHPLGAQEHHHPAQVAPVQPPGFEQYLRLWGLEKPAPFSVPVPRRRPRIQVDEEKRLSYWGYRHHEAHARGLVARLHKLTGSKCCDGEESGECRISIVDMPAKKVLVDGEWCPYFDTTHIVVLDGLEAMKDGDSAIALVCAAETSKIPGTTERRRCSGVYCIGLDGQKI